MTNEQTPDLEFHEKIIDIWIRFQDIKQYLRDHSEEFNFYQLEDCIQSLIECNHSDISWNDEQLQIDGDTYWYSNGNVFKGQKIRIS